MLGSGLVFIVEDVGVVFLGLGLIAFLISEFLNEVEAEAFSCSATLLELRVSYMTSGSVCKYPAAEGTSVWALSPGWRLRLLLTEE